MAKPIPEDPLEQAMKVVIEGFKHTTQAIQDLRDKQSKMEETQKEHAQAAYNGMTGSGKSRYVSKLVEIEKAKEERGAQARVAQLLDVTPGRVSQLLSSEKNRLTGR